MNLRKAYSAICVAAVLLTAGAVQAATELGIGKPAPDFSAKDLISGKTLSLKDYRGKIVVLEWVDPLCPFDNGKHYESGNIPTMQKDFKKDGVVWLTMNSAYPGNQGDLNDTEINAWFKKVNWSADGYIRDPDGTIGHMYHATATPDMYVINKDGTLAYAGAIDSRATRSAADIPKSTNYVRQALAQIQAGKPVTTPVVQPYGCTVKYRGMT